MSDVFDEDLMKELGLDPAEFNEPSRDEKKGKPLPKPPLPAPTQRMDKRSGPPSPPKAPEPPPQSFSSSEKGVDVSAQHQSQNDLQDYGKNLSQDIPVQMVAVIAKKSLSLKDILEMKTGEILDFKRAPQDPIDLVVNGKLVAKAELVLVDGRVGARIVKLMK